MKISLHINQKEAVGLGITNLNQAHIFDLLTGVAAWASPIILDGSIYYRISRQGIVHELQLLNLKLGTMHRHLKSLADLGLIDHKRDGKKDFINLTAKGKTYYMGKESELEENHMSELDLQDAQNLEMTTTDQATKKNRSAKTSSVSFDLFYDLYENKNKRPQAERAWSRLTDQEKCDATDAIPFFNESIPDYHDKPLASSYLNSKRWTDDLTPWKPPKDRQSGILSPEECASKEREAQAGFFS